MCLLDFLEVLVSTSWYSRVLQKVHEYLLVLMALQCTGGDGLTVVMAHSPPGFILICLLVFLEVLASTSWYSRVLFERL